MQCEINARVLKLKTALTEYYSSIDRDRPRELLQNSNNAILILNQTHVRRPTDFFAISPANLSKKDGSHTM